ncbi:MAG: hypothetical protein HKM86_02235, partial [Deltaproteobacteria bacterium]|nr:hypothetical protein [Deltaproteobacteria bacterium]
TQEHYKKSIEPDDNLSPLYKDVFLFHAKEESQHAVLDSFEWPREDQKLTPDERDRAVDEVIGLVGAVDGILQDQATADVEYFLKVSNRSFSGEERERLEAGVLKAYRWQYIFSGVEHPSFQELLGSLITEAQGQRLKEALTSIM